MWWVVGNGALWVEEDDMGSVPSGTTVQWLP